MSMLTALVANPRPGSRTHRLADQVSGGLADELGLERSVVDLAELGPRLLAPGDVDVAAAREQVAATDLLVVATPVYKATYTGLLKVFLDGYGADALARVTAVGVIVSAAPAHLLATDIHLRSLLVELGAAVPTRSLGVTEGQLDGAEALVASWVAAHGARLRALTVPSDASTASASTPQGVPA